MCENSTTAGGMTAVGVDTDPSCRYNAVLCIAHCLMCPGYVGSLRNSVALEQFQPLSCGWVGYLFMDSLAPLLLDTSMVTEKGQSSGISVRGQQMSEPSARVRSQHSLC